MMGSASHTDAMRVAPDIGNGIGKGKGRGEGFNLATPFVANVVRESPAREARNPAAEAYKAQLTRELTRLYGTDWRATPTDPSPAAQLTALEETCGRTQEAAYRVDLRRRNDLVAWHRAELERLAA